MTYYIMHSYDNCDPDLFRETGTLTEVMEKVEAEYYRGHDHVIHVFDDDMKMVAVAYEDYDADWNIENACTVKILD